MEPVFQSLHSEGVRAEVKHIPLITKEEETKMWESRILGDISPQALFRTAASVMAEGGDDLNISTECDDQRQQLSNSISVVSRSLRHGLDVGISLGAKTLEEMAGYLRGKKKTLPTFDFRADFKPDFMSTCEAVNRRLLNLDETYKIFNEHEGQQLCETARQLREKLTLISFVGRLNVGKSTILNAILRARLLPIAKEVETSVKVQIFHDGRQSCSAAMAASDQHPKLLVEKGKHVPSEEIVGVREIHKKLTILNEKVREGHEEVYCTLRTNIPLLANTPPNWQVRLVDTPGTGELNSHVAKQAKASLKSTSAYVFITTYGELQSAENAKFIKFLHAHDRGVFKDGRLIVVVTQFDQEIVPDATDKEITVKNVQERVCQSVQEACPDVKISCDDVIPLSGLWAYSARMLMCHQDKPEHDKYRRNAEWYLSKYQSLPCGQGESQSLCLTELSDSELAERLLDISRFASLEASIHDVTKSCIKVWVSKMKGDYERYLKEARTLLWERLASVYERQMEQEKDLAEAQGFLNAIDIPRCQLEETMKSKVYEALEKAYPKDVEVSQTLQKGKEVILEAMNDFQEQCIMKVTDKQVEFGPHELEEDLRAFLEKISTEVEQIFNSTCVFTSLHQVLRDHVSKMTEKATVMRGNAQVLCTTPEKRVPLELAKAVEASKEESSSELPGPPNLGFIKEKVNIPPVSLSWWSKLTQFLSNLFHYFWDIGSEETTDKLIAGVGDRDGSDGVEPDCTSTAAKPSKSSSYRTWDEGLQYTMRDLQVHLEEECDNYFTTKIKQETLKYFHDQYCRETRAQLEAFDVEYRVKIDEARRKLQEMERMIDNNVYEINELSEVTYHLVELSIHLYDKTERYVSSISQR